MRFLSRWAGLPFRVVPGLFVVLLLLLVLFLIFVASNKYEFDECWDSLTGFVLWIWKGSDWDEQIAS